MSSRASILAALAKNKPAPTPLPALEFSGKKGENLLEVFREVAVNIGSRVFPVTDYRQVEEQLLKLFPEAKNIVSRIEAPGLYERNSAILPEDPHALETVDLAVLRGQIAVAENSAIWITEQQMGHRVLPFICQHLAIVIDETEMVANMHEAYSLIAGADYGYGVFIAGPSKTADIEQSLVLGAHGPRSLSVFILGKKME